MAPRRIGALNPAAIPAFQSIRPTEAPRGGGLAVTTGADQSTARSN
jgi:hypothetical protein